MDSRVGLDPTLNHSLLQKQTRHSVALFTIFMSSCESSHQRLHVNCKHLIIKKSGEFVCEEPRKQKRNVKEINCGTCGNNLISSGRSRRGIDHNGFAKSQGFLSKFKLKAMSKRLKVSH